MTDADRPALPGSRWRTDTKSSGGSARGAGDRVRLAQRQARAALLMSAGFVVAALLAAVLPHDAGRWLPLHLFLAGGLVLAISGGTVLFTVTWAAAPAPSPASTLVQRTLVALGAAGIAVARELDLPAGVLGASAAAWLAGVLLLGALLIRTVRRGVERRFDVAAAWYVTGVVAGVGAGLAGAAMGTGHPGGGDLRGAHVSLNLLGLVGLVIGGTLPTFAATAARSRLSARATPRRHGALLVAQAGALVVAVWLLWAGHREAAGVAFLAYAGTVGALALLLPVPNRKKATWAGPRLIGLWAGMAWWGLAVAATGAELLDDGAAFADRWLIVLVVAGYAQILWAALGYLAPMLRGGGHERLTAGFATTRSWVGLAAANCAGVAAALDVPVVLGAAVAVWALDTAVRAALLRGTSH